MARLLILAVVAVFAASWASTAQATPPVDENGCTNAQVFWQGECQAPSTPITICHAAGLAGTTHYNTLNITLAAAVGQAGHFNENGTPAAGHEQDYLGPCEEGELPVDVCPNIDGDQEVVPDGYFVDPNSGDCIKEVLTVPVCDPAIGEIAYVFEDEVDRYLPVDDPACEENTTGGSTGGTTGHSTGGTTGGTILTSARGELPHTGFSLWIPLLAAVASLAGGAYLLRRSAA